MAVSVIAVNVSSRSIREVMSMSFLDVIIRIGGGFGDNFGITELEDRRGGAHWVSRGRAEASV